MSRKQDLKNAIDDCEQEIEALEKKLLRSQTVLMLALLEGTEPDKNEADYFKLYASLIDKGRERLKKLNEEYINLYGKK